MTSMGKASVIEFYNFLAANRNATDSNAVQSWFASANDELTLPVGLYEFEGFVMWGGTGAATTHTTSITFGGTATLATLGAFGEGSGKTAQATFTATNSSLGTLNATPSGVSVVATNTLEGGYIHLKGYFEVTVAGTVIPQLTFSVAPGNTPIIRAGSFFKAWKLTTSPVGSWS